MLHYISLFLIVKAASIYDNMRGAFITINRGDDRNKLRKIEVVSESGNRERVRPE